MSALATKEKQTHLLYLDSLRGVAALLVVLHHACMQVNFVGVPLSALHRSVLFWFQNGHYPVDFFIVLSGFCLMIPATRNGYSLPKGKLDFFKRRARRILPPYYLAMAFSLVLIWTLIGRRTGSHWDVSIPVSRADILLHLALVQDVFVATSYKINHVFWSIAVEWRIYFLFPLLLWLWRRRGPGQAVLAVSVLALGLVMLLQYLHGYYPQLNNSTTGIVPHYILLFALGMLGADIMLGQRTPLAGWQLRHWAGVLAGLTLLLLAATILKRLELAELPWQLADVLVGMWAVSLLLLCHRLQDSPHRWAQQLTAAINWRPLVLVGTFGYSLYLVHAPLLQLLWQYVLVPLHLSPFATFEWLATGGTAVILVVSYLFFLACEKPFMTKKRVPTTIKAIIEPAI